MSETKLSNEQWLADITKTYGAGRSLKRVHFTEEQDAVLVALREAGVSYDTIAKEFVKRFNVGGMASIRARLQALRGE